MKVEPDDVFEYGCSLALAIFFVGTACAVVWSLFR